MNGLPIQFESPAAIALRLVRTPRFAFFRDSRGVVFCEEVDRSKVVMSCLGKTQVGQPTLYRQALHWEGDEEKFTRQGLKLHEMGYVIEEDMAYMVPNHWDVVKVLKTVDVKHGKKFRRILRKGTPEGFYDGQPDLLLDACDRKVHDKYHEPVQPFTEMVLHWLDGATATRQHYAEMFDRRDLTTGEQAWLDRWINFG